jgi:hypothetical protein
MLLLFAFKVVRGYCWCFAVSCFVFSRYCSLLLLLFAVLLFSVLLFAVFIICGNYCILLLLLDVIDVCY